MKTKLPTILIALLAALFTATVARADDAELKKQLVGTWNDREIGLVTVLKANGTLVSGRLQEKWDVKDGHFIEIGTTTVISLLLLFLSRDINSCSGMTPTSNVPVFGPGISNETDTAINDGIRHSNGW